MADVTIHELRTQGRDILVRIEAGEHVTVTCDGRPVAELRPVRARGTRSASLLARWRRLPVVDADALRRDVDDLVVRTIPAGSSPA